MKQPMLADDAKMDLVRWPILASAKLDGIRGVVVVGKDGPGIYSRTGKLIPNRFTQAYFQSHFKLLEGLDGELIVGEPNDPLVYNTTSSGIMRQSGEPDFSFYIFDDISEPDSTYDKRKVIVEDKVRKACAAKVAAHLEILDQHLVNNLEELDEIEKMYVDTLGYEGLILRDPKGLYKFGRSTAKQGLLLKLKRFEDSEAIIVGVKELLMNGNDAKEDEFGHTERSSHKDNMVPMETLGAFILKDVHGKWEGREFGSGSGPILTKEGRKRLWNARDELKGKIVSYKYFSVGCKDLPRFPIVKGFRDKMDFDIKQPKKQESSDPNYSGPWGV